MYINSVTTRVRQKETFLDKIDNFVSWKTIGRFIKYKMGKKCNATGRLAYSTLKMFKIMLLQCWYNINDRDMSYALFDRISFRKFTGFPFNYTIPSYSTLCRFRNNCRFLYYEFLRKT